MLIIAWGGPGSYMRRTTIVSSAAKCARSDGRRHRVRTLDLMSRLDRVAANRLYERLGFRPRESTVYRFQADPAS
jgi:hypothetical protein